MSAIEFDEDHFTPNVKPIGARALVADICNRYDVTLAQVLERDKHKSISRARMIAYWALKQRGYSYPEIAEILARKDHTTPMHGVHKINRLRSTDPAFARELEELRGLI